MELNNNNNNNNYNNKLAGINKTTTKIIQLFNYSVIKIKLKINDKY